MTWWILHLTLAIPVQFPRAGTRVIDSLTVYMLSHNFKLASAYRHFCGALQSSWYLPAVDITGHVLVRTHCPAKRQLCCDSNLRYTKDVRLCVIMCSR